MTSRTATTGTAMSEKATSPDAMTDAAAQGCGPESRRKFLKVSAALGGAAVFSQASSGQAATASGAYEPFSKKEIKVGLVGCGGRGTGAIRQILNAEGPIRLVAMADAFDYRLKSSLDTLKQVAGKEGKAEAIDVPASRQHSGLDAYAKVIESDCDLVVLATPPGFRPAQFEAAVDAGKHVFMEKPVATDAPGIRRILAAGKKAEERGLAVQVGLQRRHEPKYLETVKRLHDGAIGDILLTRVYWNSSGVWVRGRKPEQTEMEYQVDNWYYFLWTCGGQIVEQHIHNLDVSNWVKQAIPVTAQGQGGREVRTSKATGQIFDHSMVEYTYPDGSKMLSCCRHVPGAWGQVAEYAHGTNGSANIGLGRILDANGKIVWRYKAKRSVQGHQQEQLNLIKALRAGEVPSETEYGALSTMTAIMGRMAAHSGKEIKWGEAINSDLDLGPKTLAWDAEAPVLPDADGRYPVPVPGKTVVI
ncbi:MAG: Gfo/Idh/MocA family oxidoreductase [Planctomycetota bacterium]